MLAKARANVLYPKLRELLRKAAPQLVPFRPQEVAADKEVYRKSKQALPGHEAYARKWPRMCLLLCGHDDSGTPKFFHVKPNDEEGSDDEPSPFVVFVDSLLEFGCIEVVAHAAAHAPHAAATRRHAPCTAAAHATTRTRRRPRRRCPRRRRPRRPHLFSPTRTVQRVRVRAQPADLQEGLIAFASYIAGQIAAVVPRAKGHVEFLNKEVQGAFEPHDQWNPGIKRALKFFRDRVACSTDDPVVLAYRRRADANSKASKRKRSEQ